MLFRSCLTRDRNILPMKKINIANRIIPLRFSMLRRITTLFYLGTRTCVRCIEYGVTAITYGVTTGRVLKKPMVCLRTRRFFQNTLAVAIVSGLAFYDRVGHTSPLGVTFQKPQNTCRCPLLLRITLHFILFIWILFWIYFFQTTHRLFYLTVTRKLIIGKYKYCKRFAECNSSKNFVSL